MELFNPTAGNYVELVAVRRLTWNLTDQSSVITASRVFETDYKSRIVIELKILREGPNKIFINTCISS
jgi:hypothetical protein